MIISEAQRREETRRAVMEFLAPRQTLKFDAETLVRRINQTKSLDFILILDDIAAALAFLRDLKFVELSHSKVGSTNFYQATSAGVLAHERGELG